jgi:hypothetical protein
VVDHVNRQMRYPVGFRRLASAASSSVGGHSATAHVLVRHQSAYRLTPLLYGGDAARTSGATHYKVKLKVHRLHSRPTRRRRTVEALNPTKWGVAVLSATRSAKGNSINPLEPPTGSGRLTSVIHWHEVN